MFYCYSLQLKNFLKLQGLSYVNKGLHKNGNHYWTFDYSDKFGGALDKWNEYKKVFKIT